MSDFEEQEYPLQFSTILDRQELLAGQTESDLTCHVSIKADDYFDPGEGNATTVSICLLFDCSLSMKGKNFQAGVDALAKLTSGAVHLSLNAAEAPAKVFTDAKNVKHYWFEGKHPAGNVGIQIHHINPILKDDIVWTIGPEDVVTLGRFFNEGKFDPVRTVALGGPRVKNPKYLSTRQGAGIADALKDNLTNDHIRVISGNVLSGKAVAAEKGFLGFYHNQVSVLEEGTEQGPLSPAPQETSSPI